MISTSYPKIEAFRHNYLNREQDKRAKSFVVSDETTVRNLPLSL